MFAIGGSWWSLSIEPQFMQDLAHVTITTWAMDGFYDLLYFDLGIGVAVSRFRFE